MFHYDFPSVSKNPKLFGMLIRFTVVTENNIVSKLQNTAYRNLLLK